MRGLYARLFLALILIAASIGCGSSSSKTDDDASKNDIGVVDTNGVPDTTTGSDTVIVFDLSSPDLAGTDFGTIDVGTEGRPFGAKCGMDDECSIPKFNNWTTDTDQQQWYACTQSQCATGECNLIGNFDQAMCIKNCSDDADCILPGGVTSPWGSKHSCVFGGVDTNSGQDLYKCVPTANTETDGENRKISKSCTTSADCPNEVCKVGVTNFDLDNFTVALVCRAAQSGTVKPGQFCDFDNTKVFYNTVCESGPGTCLFEYNDICTAYCDPAASTSNCPAGWKCIADTILGAPANICVPGACQSDKDCDSDEYCVASPNYDSTNPAVNNYCVKKGANDKKLGDDCTRTDPCHGDPGDFLCVTGYCTAICATDADCSALDKPGQKGVCIVNDIPVSGSIYKPFRSCKIVTLGANQTTIRTCWDKTEDNGLYSYTPNTNNCESDEFCSSIVEHTGETDINKPQYDAKHICVKRELNLSTYANLDPCGAPANFTSCTTNQNCPEGQVCSSGACRFPACESGADYCIPISDSFAFCPQFCTQHSDCPDAKFDENTSVKSVCIPILISEGDLTSETDDVYHMVCDFSSFGSDLEDCGPNKNFTCSKSDHKCRAFITTFGPNSKTKLSYNCESKKIGFEAGTLDLDAACSSSEQCKSNSCQCSDNTCQTRFCKTPLELGSACLFGSNCESGWCNQVESDPVCTKICAPGTCPNGFRCHQIKMLDREGDDNDAVVGWCVKGVEPTTDVQTPDTSDEDTIGGDVQADTTDEDTNDTVGGEDTSDTNDTASNDTASNDTADGSSD